MKRKFIYAIALVMGLVSSVAFTSCDDDDDDNSVYNAAAIIADIDTNDKLEYSKSANGDNWKKYMIQVATLLNQDASKLYSEWTGYYAADFKASGATGTSYKTARAATNQIISGMVDIANEVGSAKIGDPVTLWNAGEYEEAVYAVESWYSYHSRIDYSNNIKSIQNAYYGSLDGTVATNSISAAVKASNVDLDNKVRTAISNAITAIMAIPQPFRSNLFSSEAQTASDACADLKVLLDGDLRVAVGNLDAATCIAINIQFVDAVVLPTYRHLATDTEELLSNVKAFDGTSFADVCDIWVTAREYWEKSEAFLFGPVADMGLDPNMDSWPLDRTAISSIIVSGDFSGMNWDGEYNEDSESIAAAQSVRGFHTLEYLIFKQGNPRSITE